MTNLYFLNNKNEQELVTKDVSTDKATELALADLEKRKPEIISYYQRCWFDDHNRMWIDYGSHTEFYILQEPEMAKNLAEKVDKNILYASKDIKDKVHEIKVEHSCHADYCEL